MKTLYESLLDDFDTIAGKIDVNDYNRRVIDDWIRTNYQVSGTLDISKKPNKDGKHTVSCNGRLALQNQSSTSLTNGLFIFKFVKTFDCSHSKIESLEGAPIECEEFRCSGCQKLVNLVGSPKKLSSAMHCDNCYHLKSLEGCSRFVRNVYCSCCHALETLQGAPKQVSELYIDHCYNLKKANIKTLPKSMYKCYCIDCGFSKQDIAKNSRVDDIVA
jgi:hypothetical protein